MLYSLRRAQGREPGFTIVELLIVIVVVAILATISIVAYQGIQVKANNAMRLAEAQEWVKLFGIYASLEGSYPASDRYCLGRGFPKYQGREIGSCWDANGTIRADENEAIMSDFEFVTQSTLPKYSRLPIVENGIERVGPVLWGNSSTEIYMIKYFLQSATRDAANAECPAGSKLWNSVYTYSCVINLPSP